MSNSTTARNNNNPQLIDQYGSYVGLIRKRDEGIDSFKDRVVQAYRDLYELDNESFYRSLGYITSSREKNLFTITLENVELINCSIKSNYESLILDIEGEQTTFLYQDYKFIIDLYNALNLINNIKVEMLAEDDSWHFLHCKNIKSIETDRLFLRQFIEEFIVELPRENVVDFSLFLSDEFDFQVEGDTLIRDERGFKKGYFAYKDFPVILTWTPFAAAACNSNEFENIVKDEYGNITQRGAKVVNRILEKQNTYWGN